MSGTVGFDDLESADLTVETVYLAKYVERLLSHRG
jgi:hypothetical protein